MNIRRNALLLTLALVTLVTTPIATAHEDLATLTAQVRSTEIAFAKTMADRDFAAFQRFVSQEAIFFSGDEALRGKAAVAERWSRFYKDAAAPFSWSPDHVEVLDSGALALSTGPVLDSGGQRIGRFASIWRQEQPGVWRIVFDRGESAPAR